MLSTFKITETNANLEKLCDEIWTTSSTSIKEKSQVHFYNIRTKNHLVPYSGTNSCLFS